MTGYFSFDLNHFVYVKFHYLPCKSKFGLFNVIFFFSKYIVNFRSTSRMKFFLSSSMKTHLQSPAAQMPNKNKTCRLNDIHCTFFFFKFSYIDLFFILFSNQWQNQSFQMNVFTIVEIKNKC